MSQSIDTTSIDLNMLRSFFPTANHPSIPSLIFLPIARTASGEATYVARNTIQSAPAPILIVLMVSTSIQNFFHASFNCCSVGVESCKASINSGTWNKITIILKVIDKNIITESQIKYLCHLVIGLFLTNRNRTPRMVSYY